MPKYIDSHCHITASESFDSAFAHANTFGVVGCVVNAITQDDWDNIVNITQQNKNVIGCIGIHPWHVDTAHHGWDYDMGLMLRNNRYLQVGEIGLDKTHDNFAAQEKIFIRSLELAIEYNRTINLHCVHAWDVVLNTFKIYKSELPKIIAHSFDGTQNAIDFDDDFYFSYSPNIANPMYKKIRASIPSVPKNRILIESDSTDLSKTLIAAQGVLSLRPDITSDDILNNATRVFFYG